MSGLGLECTGLLSQASLCLSGEPQKFRVRFLRAAGYPVDLYYLMDLSYSMKDDLERVRQLGHALLVRLQEVTHSVRIGERAFTTQTLPALVAAFSFCHRLRFSQRLTDLIRPLHLDISPKRHSFRCKLEGISD